LSKKSVYLICSEINLIKAVFILRLSPTAQAIPFSSPGGIMHHENVLQQTRQMGAMHYAFEERGDVKYISSLL
jgi:hypothetical protein